LCVEYVGKERCCSNARTSKSSRQSRRVTIRSFHAEKPTIIEREVDLKGAYVWMQSIEKISRAMAEGEVGNSYVSLRGRALVDECSSKDRSGMCGHYYLGGLQGRVS